MNKDETAEAQKVIDSVRNGEPLGEPLQPVFPVERKEEHGAEAGLPANQQAHMGVPHGGVSDSEAPGSKHWKNIRLEAWQKRALVAEETSRRIEAVSPTGEAMTNLDQSADTLRELLEALEAICGEAESWHSMHHAQNLIQCDSICKLIPKMRRAIKRARGQQ
jgi:hypothetical protein